MLGVPVVSLHRGFTLIELMVTLTVFSILLALAVPNFSAWIANNKVRAVADSLQNDLREAQSEAIKRSRRVALILTNATPAASATPASNGKYWYLQTIPLADASDDSAVFIHGNTSAKQNAVTLSGSAMVCFNSVGRLIADSISGLGSCSAPSDTDPIMYSISVSGADRPLKVQVAWGGQVRMCDPAKTLSTDHPDGC